MNKDYDEFYRQFQENFQAERERFLKLRNEMDAERENRPSYYELQRECRWRGFLNVFLSFLLFLTILALFVATN